jgi:hypothetical protein
MRPPKTADGHGLRIGMRKHDTRRLELQKLGNGGRRKRCAEYAAEMAWPVAAAGRIVAFAAVAMGMRSGRRMMSESSELCSEGKMNDWRQALS